MAFFQCHSLSHIRIPSSVTYIGHWAFASCQNLISIEFPPPPAAAQASSSSSDRQDFQTDRTTSSTTTTITMEDLGIYKCNKLVNVVVTANPSVLLMRGNGINSSSTMETFLQESRIGSLIADVDGWDDFVYNKLMHRFDNCPLNELCYFQSYYSSEDAMMKLHSLMENDPSGTTTTKVDEFGMTPLHILSLSQTPNLSMLLTVMMMMNGGHSLDHIILGKDAFGNTPMDYLCWNKKPKTTQVIQSLLQATVGKRINWLGLDRWKSNVMQVLDKALAIVDSCSSSSSSSRKSWRKVIGMAYFQLANYERLEVLSLMELFLWNSKIVEEDHHHHHDGASNRQSCRINSGATIVIPNVLCFLGKVELEDYVLSN
eukprot:scaffold11153_cov85-Cylindrotheca_fusiformis.AAC.2